MEGLFAMIRGQQNGEYDADDGSQKQGAQYDTNEKHFAPGAVGAKPYHFLTAGARYFAVSQSRRFPTR